MRENVFPENLLKTFFYISKNYFRNEAVKYIWCLLSETHKAFSR